MVLTANTAVALPLLIPPSEGWCGNDGQWSTFMVEIGTPGQMVELLPGTSATAGNAIWTVIPQGCTQENPGLADCRSMRGQLFMSNQSLTWSTSRIANKGLFNLATLEEGLLGLTGNAWYGFDTVRLGGTINPGLPTLRRQLIAGIATNNFWVGSFGLSPLAFNFTNLNDPIPSLLGTLRDQNLIPSTTWAYTAGASYRQPPVFGSLIFGGYDASRRSNQSTISIPFGTDISRDLLIGLQSITYNTLGSSPLLSNGIYAFIDSMVAQMWLPVSVCEAFEKAFNLTWNATTELYLLTAAQHTVLLQQNPTFTFSIGSSSSGGDTAKIILPYAAFDLSVGVPLIGSETRYFPLKRAQNSTQYTLGRVFLQEAYVTADYDRRNFSVSQALFPDREIPQRIVAIGEPEAKAHAHGTTHFSAGATAGIVVGTFVALAVVIAALLCIHLRQGDHGSDQRKQESTDHNQPLGVASEVGRLYELNVESSAVHESDSRRAFPPELDASVGRYEQHCQYYELSDLNVAAAELEASGRGWI